MNWANTVFANISNFSFCILSSFFTKNCDSEKFKFLVPSQNFAWQNVEWQKIETQNAESENVKKWQNVESDKKSKMTKAQKLQNV